MGLFSSKKTVYVSSTVYNLAGEEKDRPIFLKNLVIRNILSGTKRSMGETIPTGYLKGPGIKFRSFFRWAEREYDLIGIPTGAVQNNLEIPVDVVAQQIPHTEAESVWVQDARLSEADYERWVEGWFLANHPELISVEWEADIDDETFIIKVQMYPEGKDGPKGDVYTFPAVGYDPLAKYIYAYYVKTTEDIAEPIVTGPLISLVPGQPFPPLTDYIQQTESSVERIETLTETVTTANTYSDGREPDGTSTVTPVDTTVYTVTTTFNKFVFSGNAEDLDAKQTTKYMRTHIEDFSKQSTTTIGTSEETLPDGVIKTTTTLHTVETLVPANKYQTDTQRILEKIWQNMQLYIYKMGGNNPVLNALATKAEGYGKFFPIIPMRMKTDWISDEDRQEEWGDIYKLAKRAYKKATDGAKFDKLVDQLRKNDDIKDMDYIFAVYGVSLNVIDKSCKKYLYLFFKEMMGLQNSNGVTYDQFKVKMAAYDAAFKKWLAWKKRHVNDPPAQHEDDGGFGYLPPKTNPDPEPKVPKRPTMPETEMNVTNPGIDINYETRLIWNYIGEYFETGKGKTGAKKGDVWLAFQSTTTINTPIYGGNNDRNNGDFPTFPPQSNFEQTEKFDTVRIYWQYEDNKYKYMDLVGLKFRNNVYGGKSVKISAKEALEDAEESGFLVPIHHGLYRSMSLVDATQMSTAMMFLQINCYQIVKQKWWQKGIFKILFVIVIAIVSVVFTGGAGIGLLGAHAAVGASLGLTGMTAAIVGSVANALAAMVLSTIIEKLTAKMGILGSIIGAVVGIVMSGAISSAMSGGGFTFNLSNLMRADNLLKLMDAGARGYTAMVQANILDMQSELEKIQEETNAASRKVREQYVSNFGYGGGTVDPTMFVDNNPVIAESRDTFLTRTLMSGSDVADMTHELLSNYAELTLTLPDAFT